MIIDLHTHTFPNSDDSSLTPDQLIEQAKSVGLDGICITDHDRFWSFDEAQALSKAHGFLVIPGCEVTTEEGHLLVYGLDTYIFGMHSAGFVNNMAVKAGAAMVLAHPYRRAYFPDMVSVPGQYDQMIGRVLRNPALEMVDALDVLNGRATGAENDFSTAVADRSRMRGIGASDAHDTNDLGNFATEFEQPITGLEDLITALKSGRFSPVVMNSTKGTVDGN